MDTPAPFETSPAHGMTDANQTKLQAKREYGQLLRLHEQLLAQLQRVRDELTSSSTRKLLKEIRAQTGSAPPMTDVTNATEEAIRALKLSEAQIRKSILDTHDNLEVEGVPNLPTHLQRFLAERASMPGFSYEVITDEVRGWVICWKEYTGRGTVRGYGQISERPYAWIED